MQAVPKRRTSLGLRIEDVNCPRVLSPDNAVPKGGLSCVLKEPSYPFNHKSNIHDSSIHDPKATLILRLKNLLLIHLVLLAFLTSPLPKKPTYVLVEAGMSPICQ
jgi:hypothetical protein